MIAFIAFSLFALELKAEPVRFQIFANDSLLSKRGFLTAILSKFKEECACEVEAIRVGGAGAVLSRYKLDLEAKRPTAALLMGIDQHLYRGSKELFEEFKNTELPKAYAKIEPEFKVGSGFIAFDYGIFSLIADTKAMKEKNLELPKSFKDLNHPRYLKKILLQDPRTSSPGQAFVMMISEVFGDGFSDYFRKFKKQWLTLAPDWESAYGMFLKEQAPLVWSYTTSQAYHEENGDASGRYQAILMAEGAPIQIEGVVLTRTAAKDPAIRKVALQFFEYILRPEVQQLIAKTQWMFPVDGSSALPESFKKLPMPVRKVRGDQAGSPVQVLKLWETAVQTPSP